jgi:hypothetical protein
MPIDADAETAASEERDSDPRFLARRQPKIAFEQPAFPGRFEDG